MLKITRPSSPLGEDKIIGFEEPVEKEDTRISNLDECRKVCIVHNPRWLNVPLFAFPWFSGFFSGVLTLIAKCTIMLAVHLFEEDNSKSAFTYVIFISLPVFVLLEISTLNLGFKYFDTCNVVPIFKASIVFHNTICGGILLQEFFEFRRVNILMYAIGI